MGKIFFLPFTFQNLYICLAICDTYSYSINCSIFFLFSLAKVGCATPPASLSIWPARECATFGPIYGGRGRGGRNSSGYSGEAGGGRQGNNLNLLINIWEMKCALGFPRPRILWCHLFPWAGRRLRLRRRTRRRSD